MKNASRIVFGGMFVVAVISWVSICTTGAAGQTAGNNAVYNSSGNCNSMSHCAGSSAFIDASVFATFGGNFCGVLNGILSGSSYSYPSTGAVIDARGLPFTTPPTSMTCSSTQPSPWTGITNPPPSTILLPAGTIGIPGTWVLPSNTRLIGEGDGIPPSSGAFPGTRIQLVSGNTVSSMIQFGSSSSCSGGISVERLTLDGQAQAIDGIVNQYCPGPSSVDHVTLFQILGTGLSVSANANDSGPYANIRFDTGGYSGTSSTACAQIKSNRTSSVRRPA